ncbi:MAG: hypothetical protein Q8M76_06765 [Spirochaetaceae bacterium]|nr:hypothetical protein [Spirochaetaceae bacterium]
MRTYGSFMALCAELEGDVADLRRVGAVNERAWARIVQGADDQVDWGALGFTLHTFYGVLEGYFLRVSKFFENSLPTQAWHKALLEKMRLDIPGLRPSVFRTDEEFRLALELLKFRHRILNLYGEDLDPGKTREIQLVAQRLLDLFPPIHEEFRAKLLAIAGKLA